MVRKTRVAIILFSHNCVGLKTSNLDFPTVDHILKYNSINHASWNSFSPFIDLDMWHLICLSNSGPFDVWSNYSYHYDSYNHMCHDSKASLDGNFVDLFSYPAIAAAFSIITLRSRFDFIIPTFQTFQVWGLFAPKYVFDAIGLLLTDLLICLASLYYCWRCFSWFPRYKILYI
jgi:hypothetical protein